MQTGGPTMAMIAVLYDTTTGKLLGKGAQWYTVREFAENAPQRSEDLIPPQHAPAEKDPDPGPTYKCINHVLHVCSGNVCYPLGARC
jgi:hypothetical protein